MKMRHAISLFHAKAQDICDPTLTLSKPIGVVVEQEEHIEGLARTRTRKLLEFVIEQVAAQDQAQHLARRNAALRRAKDDVARDGQCILLHAVADFGELILSEGEPQLR